MARKNKAEDLDFRDADAEVEEKTEVVNRTVTGITGDFTIKISSEKIRIYEKDEEGLDTFLKVVQPDDVEEIEIVREGESIAINFK